MLPRRCRIVLCLMAVCVPANGWAQTALSVPAVSESPPYRIYPSASPAINASPDTNGVIPATGFAPPLIANPDTYEAPPTPAAPPSCRLITDARLNYTSVPGRNTGDIDMSDIELGSTWNLNWGLAPLKISPYIAAHLWNIGDANPFLYLYDLNVEFAWRPRLFEWLFVDLAVTPGLYTDFKDVNGSSFQMRGRAAAIVAFSEKLQLVGGVMYVNRNHITWLPAGGVIWTPSADTRFFLVFPQPKISQRLCMLGTAPVWGYFAGEFGGGRWEVERSPGIHDSLDYTDWRLLAGLEAGAADSVRGYLEFGYVFNRRVNYLSSSADLSLPSTAMVRVGFRY